MADIRKRQGKKGVTYQVRYPNASTKTGYSFKTFRTMKEARAFSGQSSDWDTGSQSSINTVVKAVDLWLDICEKVGRDGRETVEPQTLVEYKRRAKAIREYQWPSSLEGIKPTDVVQFRTWLLENKSRDMAKRTLSSLHSIFIEMKVQGHISHDPVSGIQIRVSGRHEKPEVQILNDKEMKRLLASTETLKNKNNYMEKAWRRYQPMIYLAIFSGLRPSEYRGLTWDNVTRESVTITQRADKKGIIGAVKSRAARRTIYLPRIVTDMIFSWKEYCPYSESNLVFPTKSGKPLLIDNIRQSCWLPLLKEASLLDNNGGKLTPKYTLYSLRHYYASKLIESKKDSKFIQEMMGHSSIELTYNVYGHLIGGKEEEHKKSAEDMALAILS